MTAVFVVEWIFVGLTLIALVVALFKDQSYFGPYYGSNSGVIKLLSWLFGIALGVLAFTLLIKWGVDAITDSFNNLTHPTSTPSEVFTAPQGQVGG